MASCSYCADPLPESSAEWLAARRALAVDSALISGLISFSEG